MNKQPLIIRINELEELINDKTVNLDEFDEKRKKLKNEIHLAEQNIQPFTTLLKESDEKIINLRKKDQNIYQLLLIQMIYLRS